MKRLKQRPGSPGPDRVGLATDTWEIKRAAFKLAWLGLAWFQRGWGVGGEGAACPLPPKHTPDPMAGCDVQLLWHFVCVCGGRPLNWLGLAWLGLVSAGVGGWGGGGRLAPSPPSTHLIQWPAAMYNFCGILFVSVERWHCVYICGYKHDWAPAASNKDTVAMGFVRGTAMVDFHIHGRLEKNGLG